MGTLPPKKVINADAGDADHVGGNDWDDVADWMNNVDKTGPIKFNTDTYFRSNKFWLRNPADTFNYKFVTSAIAADRTITLPLLTADDTPAFLVFPQTFTGLKTFTGGIALDSQIGITKDETITLTGTQNNLAVADTTNYIRFNPASSLTVTGIAVSGGNSEGDTIILHNVSSNSVILSDENGSSTAGNRFALNANQTLLPDQSGAIHYDATSLRWRLWASSIDVTQDPDSVQTFMNKTIDARTFNNSTGNIIRTGIDNPFLGTGSGAVLRRDGLFPPRTSTGGEGILGTGLTAIGANSDQRSSTEGFLQQQATGAVANANAGLRQTVAFYRREWGSYMILRVGFSSTSDIRVFIGWSSDSAEIAGETTLNNFSGCGVGKRAGDTNWFTYRNDGDATEDRVDTGIVFAASFVTIEMQLDSTNFQSKIGSTVNTAETTELPAAATDLFFKCEIETGAGAADKNIQIGPILTRTGTA